jgi:hypothetical protein
VKSGRAYFWAGLLALTVVVFMGGCQLGQRAGQTEQSSVPTIQVQPTATSLPISASPLSSPVDTPTVRPTPTIPTPAQGKAVIRGSLISSVTQQPIGETLFYLTPGVGENGDRVPPILAGPLEKDIRGLTDKQGGFDLNAIPPGNYFMIIWAPLNWVVLAEITGSNSVTPILLDLQPDQVRDLGEMVISWP